MLFLFFFILTLVTSTRVAFIFSYVIMSLVNIYGATNIVCCIMVQVGYTSQKLVGLYLDGIVYYAGI